jgi:hypothetical protein
LVFRNALFSELAAIGTAIIADFSPGCSGFGSVEPVAALLAFLLAVSSPSARMVSSFDSTPATACCRKEPHLEEGLEVCGGEAIDRDRCSKDEED